MKVLAILLMLLTIVMIVGFGMFYLLGFAMSFDAPGSTTDPKAWGMRLLIFAPILIFLVCLIMAWKAYAGGEFGKSVVLGAVAPVICIALYAWMAVTSMSSMKQYNDQVAKEKELEAKYPVEKYIRTADGVSDTIIVWPTGIVAYRLNIGVEYPWNGPLGELSEDRKTITYDRRPDTKLQIEELYHFMDEEGRIFTNVYAVK
jgi:heme/copper-type cytochrome/quinol oxidase subunit 2